MALLEVRGRRFDAGLVAFDKDGTLIDFEFMWGRLAKAWAEILAPGRNHDYLRADLLRAWGYDPAQEHTLPQSPLAIASTAQLQTIAAVTLYLHGFPWTEADNRARMAFHSTTQSPALDLSHLLRPAGDVAGLFGRLHAHGVRVAVVTTDRYAETEDALRLMGVRHLVACIVSSDGGLALKPAPDMLLDACARTGVSPANTAVVGDTEGDMLMARRAGAGLKVAVLGGVGDPAVLEQYADVVASNIDEIRLA